eukprot:12426067-Karenia_brevis.AAC.1
MVDARSAEIYQCMDVINEEAESHWRAVEVTIPKGFTDPWVRTFGTYRPEDDDKDFMCDPHVNPTFNANDLKCYRDKSFPLEDRVDDFQMCLVIDVDMHKIFYHLGATPAPIGNVPEKAAYSSYDGDGSIWWENGGRFVWFVGLCSFGHSRNNQKARTAPLSS